LLLYPCSMLIGFYAYVQYREKQRKNKLNVLFNLIFVL
jgi:hypothetical protein